jgi:peptidyl-prolyl cis-trans isomerase SurA
MYLLLLAFLVLAPCRAEIIDRVAVVVGNRVVTESEILLEIRLSAFLNGSPLDFSPESRRSMAEKLVEQRLIRAEMDSSHYPPPAPEAVDENLKEVIGHFPDAAKYRQELERTGITEQELKGRLQRQLLTLRFLEFRFRPGIQIGEDEIGGYFQRTLEPELRKAHPEMDFDLNDYREQIEQALIGELVDKASDLWLKEARERTHIEYRSYVFAPEPKPQEAAK